MSARCLAVIAFVSIFSWTSDKLSAQPTFSTGLKFERDRWETIPEFAKTDLVSKIPKQFHLSNYPDAGDQGPQLSCVGWAVAYSARSIIRRNAGEPNMTFSPSYIYNQLEDDPSCHSGAFLSDGLAILKTKGALPLSEFPYQRLSCTRQPTDKEHEVASRYKIFDYGRINENVPFSLDDLRYMKQAIASNYPVILGLETDDNFHSFTRRKGGEILSTPYDPTTRKGAHAVVMVGYDEDKKSVLLQNSWGNSWGNEGLAWVSYAYLLTAGFEAYIVKEAVAQ